MWGKYCLKDTPPLAFFSSGFQTNSESDFLSDIVSWRMKARKLQLLTLGKVSKSLQNKRKSEKNWTVLIMTITHLQIRAARSFNYEVTRDKPVSLISSYSERVESGMQCHNPDGCTSPEGIVRIHFKLFMSTWW